MSEAWLNFLKGRKIVYTHCLEYIKSKAEKMNLVFNWCVFNKTPVICMFQNYVDAIIKHLGIGKSQETFAALFSLGRFITFINFECHMLISKYVYLEIKPHLSLLSHFSISFSNTKLFLDVYFFLTSRPLFKLCLQWRIHLTYLCLFYFYLSFKIRLKYTVRLPLSFCVLTYHPVLYSLILIFWKHLESKDSTEHGTQRCSISICGTECRFKNSYTYFD